MLNTHSILCLRRTSWAGILGIVAISLSVSADETYLSWQVQNYAIEAPLGGLKGNVNRGRTLVKQRDKGNCLACHVLPIKEEAFHGNVGPTLVGIADRLSPAQIRLRIVDQQKINPYTVMPSFYINPLKVNRIAEDYIGKTILTAQEVEDVVAYLSTLKQDKKP